MAKDRRSFFERLTGTVSLDDYDDSFDEEYEEMRHPAPAPVRQRVRREEAPQQPLAGSEQDEWIAEETSEGQLSVDVFQTPEEIVIKAHVAGVKPDDLDVSITRDMVTVRGKREEHTEVEHDDYFYKELYWGSFSRTILLPQEVDTDQAEAIEKHGLLTIRLPKLDKEKQTKLKVGKG